MVGALGTMGRGKGRKPLPNNVSCILVTFLINIYMMAEHAVVQEEELLSLSMRPFQQAKQSGRTICFKCFEEDGVLIFFLEASRKLD